jgi:hypothetical protein
MATDKTEKGSSMPDRHPTCEDSPEGSASNRPGACPARCGDLEGYRNNLGFEDHRKVIPGTRSYPQGSAAAEN